MTLLRRDRKPESSLKKAPDSIEGFEFALEFTH